MYDITIVCFCYKDDEFVLPFSLKSANTVFGDNLKIALVDDDDNPIGPTTIEKLKNDLTCEFVYEKSKFERNKNLNGRPAVNGIVDSFIKHSNGRNGIVIKLDPDTMILKRGLFDNFMLDNNMEYIASCRPRLSF